MKKVWVEKWRVLPKWMRREMIRGGRGGWLYSGMEEIGWSWVDVVGVGFGEDLLEGMEGEIMVVGIPYLMEYIRGLVGGGKFSSYRKECGIIVMRLEYGGEVFESSGRDREEVFLGMLREVGEWYWEECRPSFSNINFGDIMRGDIEFGVPGVINFEVEVREVGEEVEIIFSDFWAAKMFMGRWNRFIMEEGGGSLYGTDYYHGRMLMVEGEVRVISVGTSGGMAPGMWGGYSSGVNYNVSVGGGMGGKVSSVYGGGGISGVPVGGVDVEVGFGDLEDMVGVGRPS